ncbi:hypothetical protein AgCh_025910 [Apium graveolens]
MSPEDTLLLHELNNDQIRAFIEAYLQPSKRVAYIFPNIRRCKHFQLPKHYIVGNKKLMMTIETELKTKKNRTNEDVEMIKIFARYLKNVDTMLPKIQINEKDDDLDNDEKKKGSASNGLLSFDSHEGASVKIRLSARVSDVVTPPRTQTILDAQGEVIHTKDELTKIRVLTILRSDSIVQGSLLDQLPLQVLGEDTNPIAIYQWSVSTSPGLNPLDASANSGSDISADQQLIDNDSDLPDESQGNVFTDIRREL